MKFILVQLVFLGTALASPLNGIMRRPRELAAVTNSGLSGASGTAGPPERHPGHHAPFGPLPNGTMGPVEPPYVPCGPEEGEPDEGEPDYWPPFWWPDGPDGGDGEGEGEPDYWPPLWWPEDGPDSGEGEGEGDGGFGGGHHHHHHDEGGFGDGDDDDDGFGGHRDPDFDDGDEDDDGWGDK